MDILEFRHPQINGIQYRVFLADEFENFSPVAMPCSHNIQKKVIYDILKTKTSYSTLLAFVFLRNSQGRYGENTIKNELTLYEMLDSY